MEKIRALRADEIECRVARVTEKGCQLLLYKDARCDKRILDEVFGTFGWQDRYEEVKGNMYCSVGVRVPETGEWIWKQDCGVESSSEKEKGEASDAFKRACFNWGIGRELYSKIFIWLNVPTKAKGNGWELADRFAKFAVSHIVTDNEKEKIIELKIADKNQKEVFSYKAGEKSQDKAGEEEPKKPQASENEKKIMAYIKEHYPDKQAGLIQLKLAMTVIGKTNINDLTEDEIFGCFKRMEAMRNG